MTKNKMVEEALNVLQESINDLQYDDCDMSKDEKWAYAMGQIELMYNIDMIDEEEKTAYENELNGYYND